MHQTAFVCCSRTQLGNQRWHFSKNATQTFAYIPKFSLALIVALAFGKFVIVEGEKAVLRGLGVRRM